MLELAELCRRRGGLRRFSYVSTAYVAGTHDGEFSEDQLDVGQGFRNPYERSKFEAEQLVRAYRGRLPIQVFRPSIIVGERATGWTVSFNVLYAPLKAFAAGRLRRAARRAARRRSTSSRSTTSPTRSSSLPTAPPTKPRTPITWSPDRAPARSVACSISRRATSGAVRRG